jgi:anhydro-N-acetylmuramic acid kinase
MSRITKAIHAIGLMSGTSADGVDAALVKIMGKALDCKIKLIAFKKFPFSKGLRELIHKASTPEYGRVDLICRLNFLIGELFAEAALEIVKIAGYTMKTIDLIGSHGQTIYHEPEDRNGVGDKKWLPSTLQIGESSLIAERTGVTTIADFRYMDMASGGIGAPLTPFAHYILFHEKGKGKIVNNIGGISNVTFLSGGGDIHDVVAFDTGPGNMLIDSLIHIITQGKRSYDNSGTMASKGNISEKLLKRLMDNPFIKKNPPKSTGREEFGYHEALKIYRYAKRYGLSDRDIIATVTGFTARSIVENYRRFILYKKEPSEIILCGGGAKNTTLIDMIKRGVEPIQVKTSDYYGFPPEAIESIAFAILGYAAISGVPANLPQVTGAKKAVVLGKIIFSHRSTKSKRNTPFNQ